MTAKIISRETIKPSSPTPRHLKHYNLSLLDQLAPPFYIPLILFYTGVNTENTAKIERISDKLKSSLSQTLTRFYPLSGRIKDHLVVCNDEGVEYSEALTTDHLSQSLLQSNSDLTVLKQFIPFDAYSTLSTEEHPITALQVSFFACGGIAIGVCIAHRVADGASVAMFLNSWAAATFVGARTEADMVAPWLSLASLFPPKDHLPVLSATGPRTKEKLTTRRLLFEAAKIAALRAQLRATSDDHPTRVEAVTALIWKCAKGVNRVRSRPTSTSVVTHVVNLRRHLLENCFGNLWCSAVAEDTKEESGDEVKELHSLLRNAIRKIDGDYVKRLESEADSLMGLNCLKEVSDEAEVYRFSCWCRFNFYEADFGWGKPVSASTMSVPFKNIVILMSTRDGDGIEALVTLLEEDMDEFLKNKELLEFVVVN